ncbi:CRISPR system Cascade subunit CasD [Frankia sp. AiPs1]|uniref:type I-E CRISPR-associated protein Cas5/CasD n=1 Tax=Frankia sp. AiPa1 TaxID=573492 RepID=UPI00202B61F9|nr:type I-E CRISPR-associated protein Cas5/CasD [Frankia sp. AiPa1]MCL9760951.1 type I-E CRISPR-associated protein Cas5/CasD [Frankia sp. AiPa1]
MSTLLLLLKGPLQSWGAGEVNRRWTHHHPTKSGVVGLLAAAEGRPRGADLTDLVELTVGIRVDQPGDLLVDYHTVSRYDGVPLPRAEDGKRTQPPKPALQTRRHYLQDAVFLVAVTGGTPGRIGELDTALRRPVYPLFLGRRSCPPSVPVSLGVHAVSLDAALATEPWHAARHHRRKYHDDVVELPTILDDPSGPGETLHDVPVSFDQLTRSYTRRRVRRSTVLIPHPDRRRTPATPPPPPPHDPLALLED